jgi:hypothetical protein
MYMMRLTSDNPRNYSNRHQAIGWTSKENDEMK